MEILDQAAADAVLQVLQTRFGYAWRAYWHPLAETAVTPRIAFDVHGFLASPIPPVLLQYLRENYPFFYVIWEYELQGGCFWKITPDELDFDWYSEKLILLPDHSAVMYYSHEESIAFTGEEMIGVIKAAHPGWRELLYPLGQQAD